MSSGNLSRIDLGNGIVVPESRLRNEIEGFRSGMIRWPRRYGPDPDQDGCRVPPHLLLREMQFTGGRPRVTLHVLDGIPPMPARHDIVSGLFGPGELVVLVGAPKAGKSAIAVHLAHMVASGGLFLGRTTRQAAVAYLALERPRETVRRLRATGAYGLPVLVARDQLALSEPRDVDALIEALQAAEAALPPPVPLGLIIVDTARKAFRGLRENDADSISIGLEALRRVLRALPRAALVLIHHLNKDGSSARGSGAILADADIELTVSKRHGQRIIEVTGANAVEEGQTLSFDIKTTDDPHGSPVVTISRADTSATALVPERPSGPNQKAKAGIPRDAAIALDALLDLAAGSDGRVALSTWRAATLEAFGDRDQTAKRVAWSKARKVLSTAGIITIEDDTVSVSDTRKRHVSAYGDEGVSGAVSAGAPMGGPAYAAYVPDHDRVDGEP